MSPCYQTLITCRQLAELQSAGRPLLLLDTGFDLADPPAGERAYLQAHLPEAHYLHLDRDLSAAKIGADGRFRGRHPLPEPGQVAQRMADLGLRADTQVVCYDAQGGMYAARAWWMLRWIGHADVAVLDGGLPAWRAEGGALASSLPAKPQPAPLLPREPLVQSMDASALLQRLGRVRLIDARAGERFRGDVEPLDKQAGHIPGASNRWFQSNLQPDGRFKPAAALRAEFEALLAPFAESEVVHQCGSGVTACHNLLAMFHAGYACATLYPGSWSEWSDDPTRPVARS